MAGRGPGPPALRRTGQALPTLTHRGLARRGPPPTRTGGPTGAAACLALAALLGACGAAPTPPPAPGPGPLPHPALVLVFVPDAVGDALAALDAHLAPGLDALGPLGAAFARVRQDAVDTLLSLAPGAAQAPALTAAWGLAPGAPVRISWAAADEGRQARALLAALSKQGQSAPTPHGPVWQLRVELQLADPEAATTAVEALTARLGWRPVEGVGPGAHRARDPEGGAVLALRVGAQGRPGAAAWGAVDLVVPAGPETPPAALWPRLRAGEGGAPPQRPEGLATLQAFAAGLAAVEAAIGGVEGLAAPAGPRRAGAEALGACVEAWAGLAALSGPVGLTLAVSQGRLRLAADVALSADGARAWARAKAPLPLPAGLPGAPAGAQIGLGSVGFPDPGLAGLPGCRLGHPALLALVGLPALPAALESAAPPIPAPPHGFGPGPFFGAAALLLGASAVAGEASPHLAGLRVGASGGEAPLGARALRLMDPEGPRWVLAEGPLPVSVAERRLGERPVLVFGLGPDAALRVARALGPAAPDPRFLEAWLELPALTEALRGAGLAGPEGAALAAVAARLGAVRLTGALGGVDLRFELTAGELDHPGGGQ